MKESECQQYFWFHTTIESSLQGLKNKKSAIGVNTEVNPLSPTSDQDRISPYNINTISTRYRDYFMENARVRFLFTSCVVSENERVSAANE